jgi:hypothetical protein
MSKKVYKGYRVHVASNETLTLYDEDTNNELVMLPYESLEELWKYVTTVKRDANG